MICPYCGSKHVIWDYGRGEIICTMCGSVIDRIYIINNLTSSRDEDTWKGRAEKDGYPRLKTITKLYLRFIKKANMLKRKEDTTIDTKALIRYLEGKGPHVKILKRKFNEAKLRDETVNRVINLMNKYPRLKSRTERAKLALALLAINIAKGNATHKFLSEVRRDTKLSTTHVKRLARLLMSEREFVIEVKKIIRKSTN